MHCSSLVHVLCLQVDQMEERQRLMMEAFQRERESLWSVISKQAHVIQRMHSAGTLHTTVLSVMNRCNYVAMHMT